MRKRYGTMVGLETTGDHVGFSWSSCDRCGSGLGGDRHEWRAYGVKVRKDGQPLARARQRLLYDGEICVDCLVAIEG